MQEKLIRKILLIDGEELFSLLVKRDLELMGNFKVITTRDGIRGLQIAQQYKPHLIVLDLMLPRIDGFEILKKLKKNENTQFIPVIILTAIDDVKAKLEAIKQFAEDYIIKPVQVKVLADKIERVLSRFLGDRNSQTDTNK